MAGRKMADEKKTMINESFFDEMSGEKWYILGAMFARCLPKGEKGIVVRSMHRELVDLIAQHTQSQYKILADPRGKRSYWFETKAVPNLRSRLNELGVMDSKKERKFPDYISEDEIRHFVRGFFEAQAIYYQKGKGTTTEIKFSANFLNGLYGVLKQYVDIKSTPPEAGCIRFGQKDSTKILNFLYKTQEGALQQGLSLETRASQLKEREDCIHPTTSRRMTKIEEAKRMLGEGKKTKDVAAQIGYSNRLSLYRAFKDTTGQTVRQYRKNNQFL